MKLFSVFLIPLIFISNFVALNIFSIYSTGAILSYLKYSIVLIFFPVIVYSISREKYLNEIINDKMMPIAMVTVVAIAASFFNTGLNLTNIMQNLQFCLIIFVAYYTGWALSKLTNESYFVAIKVTLVVCVLAVSFGVIEFLFGELIWSFYNLEAYFRIVMGFEAPLDPLNGLPRSWISWDMAGITGQPIRRMVSFFVEPVGFGRFLALNTILAFFLYLKGKLSLRKLLIIKSILFTCIILNVSKGGILLLLTFYVGWFLGARILLISVIGASFLLVSLLISGQAQVLGPSVINHLSSVVHIGQIVNAKPLGLGVNVDDVEIIRRLVNNTSQFVEEKSEGGLALYVILFGYLGLIIYAQFIRYFYKTTRESLTLEKKFFGLYGLCIMFTGIFAHSAFSLVGSGIPLLILGFINGKQVNRINYMGERNTSLRILSTRS